MAQKNETPVDSTVVTETKDGTTKPPQKNWRKQHVKENPRPRQKR